MRILIATLLLTLPALVFAADAVAPDHAAPTTTEAATYPHPRVPEHPSWANNTVAIIGLMFLAAFFIGPIVRATMPQQVEPPHAHDEHGGGAHDDPRAHDTHGHAGHH